MDPRLVEGILNRDRYCAVCDHALGTWHLHHRKLRRHGGGDSYANVIAVHPNCHNLGTHSIHLNPELAYANGWLVHSWDDPEDIPVTSRGGTTRLLTADGDTIELENTQW